MSQILSRTNKNQEKCPEGDSRPSLVKKKKKNTRETSQVQVLDKVSVLESPGLHVMSTCLQGSQPEPKRPRPKALFILKKVFEELRDVTRHHSWVGKHRSDWPACPRHLLPGSRSSSGHMLPPMPAAEPLGPGKRRHALCFHPSPTARSAEARAARSATRHWLLPPLRVSLTPRFAPALHAWQGHFLHFIFLGRCFSLPH